MAESVITQVSRDNSKPKNAMKTWYQKLCCCCYKPTVDQENITPNVVAYSMNETPPVVADQSTSQHFLLGDSKKPGKKTLVLDLDETLVHSSFKPIPDPDFIVPVEIEDVTHKVYVLKRPHVDEFLKTVGPLYEIVIFTASLSKYADPVLDLLDLSKVIDVRLFRESCSLFKGNYVKDMGRLGRSLDDVIIIDNSPTSYLFNPENAIAIETWFDDPNDNELMDLMPILRELTTVDNVRNYLPRARKVDGKLTIF